MRIMKEKSLTFQLFFIYIVVLTWAIIYKFSLDGSLPTTLVDRSVNLIPLAGSFTEDGEFCTAEFLFNIAAFVPFGIYLSAARPNLRYRWRALIFFLISFGFETIQFIFNIGVFDMTDIVTNTLGGVLGIYVFNWIYRLYKNKCRQMINTIGFAGTTGAFAMIGAYATGVIAI